ERSPRARASPDRPGGGVRALGGPVGRLLGRSGDERARAAQPLPLSPAADLDRPGRQRAPRPDDSSRRRGERDGDGAPGARSARARRFASPEPDPRQPVALHDALGPDAARGVRASRVFFRGPRPTALGGPCRARPVRGHGLHPDARRVRRFDRGCRRLPGPPPPARAPRAGAGARGDLPGPSGRNPGTRGVDCRSRRHHEPRPDRDGRRGSPNDRGPPDLRTRSGAREALLHPLPRSRSAPLEGSAPSRQRSSDRGGKRGLRRGRLPRNAGALLRARRPAPSKKCGSDPLRRSDPGPGGGIPGRRGRDRRRPLRVQLRRQGSTDGHAPSSRPSVLARDDGIRRAFAPDTIVSGMYPRPVPAAAPPRPYTVSELLAEVGGSLRASWRDVAVTGEIGRWEVRGGHGYFTLKDRTGCLNAIIFASDRERIPFRVEPGLEVVARGSLDLWPPQGKFQLKAWTIEPVGAGALQLAFEQLKALLAAEGLFDPSRKRRIPLFPRSIGLVTSPEGAAIRDIV